MAMLKFIETPFGARTKSQYDLIAVEKSQLRMALDSIVNNFPCNKSNITAMLVAGPRQQTYLVVLYKRVTFGLTTSNFSRYSSHSKEVLIHGYYKLFISHSGKSPNAG